MTQRQKLSHKAFWDTLEQRLADYSADELRNILRQFAQETRPDQRQAFLNKLHPSSAEADTAVQQIAQQEALLADIDDEIAQLQGEMESTDDEDYWDYDDEDSLGPYTDYVTSLSMLFERTEAVFDSGDRGLARQGYQKLFSVFELEDDYGRGVRSYDLTEVDIVEARARYLRSVYETEPLEQRAQRLFEQMQEAATWDRLPRFEDLIQIAPDPLPDQERFMPDWIALLHQQGGRNADTWLREAIQLSQGVEGLARLAQTEGKRRPRAYLDWLAALAQHGEHRQVLDAAHQALQELPAQLPIRAAIADHLCTAAEALNRPQQVQEGCWQAFLAKPGVYRLTRLWDVIPEEAERTARMQQAAEYLQSQLTKRTGYANSWESDEIERSIPVEKSTLVHAYLLSKQCEAAYELGADAEVLGWSGNSSHQGLVVAWLLMVLSHRTPEALPANLQRCWHGGLQNSIHLLWWEGQEGTDPIATLDRVYQERLIDVTLSEAQQQRFMSSCLKIARQRVDSIVSNKHRHSYDKAAVLACACAEALQLRGEAQQARALLNDIRMSYPRHRAFQAELKMATQSMRG